MDNNAIEVTGRWEELVSRPEFRGHQVKITIIDKPSVAVETDDWLDPFAAWRATACESRPRG